MAISVDILKKRLTTLQFGWRTLYRDGDILLSEEDLESYAEGTPTDETGPEELLAQTLGGRVVKWKPGLELSFAVLRGTFPDADRYGKVVAAVGSATQDWSRACGVRFRHVAQYDSHPNPLGRVLFVVVHYDARGEFLAAAFFPSDARTDRVVLIDPSFFGAHGFDPVGILRHELGHVLGFRHEHIRNAAAARVLGRENLGDTTPLTAYDAVSVMHYAGGSFGNRNLTITDLDRLGAQRVYGLPVGQVVELE